MPVEILQLFADEITTLFESGHSKESVMKSLDGSGPQITTGTYSLYWEKLVSARSLVHSNDSKHSTSEGALRAGRDIVTMPMFQVC